MLGMMIFDQWWYLAIPGILLALYAQLKLSSTYGHYVRIGNQARLSGAQAAREILDRAGLTSMPVEEVGGHLTDHYDPRTKTLHLSPEVYDGRSISSIAVGAHEAGHSIQDVKGYAWLGIRSNLVPVTKFGSNLWIWVFIAGQIFRSPMLIDLGILLFAGVVVFQLVTLPVEFNASNRAKAVLATSGIVQTQEEAQGVSQVLGAAAMTYVAGALTAVATLLYLLMRRRD